MFVIFALVPRPRLTRKYHKQYGGRYSSIIEEESLAEEVSAYPVLYDKASKSFKDRNKEELAWQDVVEKTSFFSQVKSNQVYVIKVFAQHVACSVVWFL